jgi:hypothetical protein
MSISGSQSGFSSPLEVVLGSVSYFAEVCKWGHFSFYKSIFTMSSGSRHHCMARNRVADRDGLQIWRVAATVLNKQSRTADMGWPSSLGVGLGANNPPP